MLYNNFLCRIGRNQLKIKQTTKQKKSKFLTIKYFLLILRPHTFTSALKYSRFIETVKSYIPLKCFLLSQRISFYVKRESWFCHS